MRRCGCGTDSRLFDDRPRGGPGPPLNRRVMLALTIEALHPAAGQLDHECLVERWHESVVDQRVLRSEATDRMDGTKVNAAVHVQIVANVETNHIANDEMAHTVGPRG